MLAVLHLQIFENGSPFDYGVTLSDAVDMPVNLGMQFVPRGRYPNAIGFLSDVIAIYPFNETFTAGQVGISSDPRPPQLSAHHDALPHTDSHAVHPGVVVVPLQYRQAIPFLAIARCLALHKQ